MRTPQKTNKKMMLLSAIGIIMVVDAHSWGALNLFASLVPFNSFFMPMFVFISGYFNKVDNHTPLWEYTKHKCKTLLVPYFCISLIALLIDWVIGCIKLGAVVPISLGYVMDAVGCAFNKGVIVEIASPLWFVPTLFAVQIVYACMKRLLYARWNSKVMLVLFSLINIVVVRYARTTGASPNNMLLLKVLFFLPFMELGICYRKGLEAKLARAIHLVLLLSLLLVNMARIMVMPKAYDLAFNSLSDLSGFTSPYVTTPLISSIVGIAFWLEIVDLVGAPLYENRIVNYISSNTFFIMGFHIIMFNILNLVLLYVNSRHPLPGFSISGFQESAWYRWEHFRQFRLAYFTVGLVGSLALKQAYDGLLRRFQPAKR